MNNAPIAHMTTADIDAEVTALLRSAAPWDRIEVRYDDLLQELRRRYPDTDEQSDRPTHPMI